MLRTLRTYAAAIILMIGSAYTFGIGAYAHRKALQAHPTVVGVQELGAWFIYVVGLALAAGAVMIFFRSKRRARTVM